MRPGRRAAVLLVAGGVLLPALSCMQPSQPEQAAGMCSNDPLVETVRRRQQLQVLVNLAGEWRPEAGLTPDEAADQRRRIATLQDGVLAALQDTDATLLRRYERVPQLALRVDEPALCLLLDLSAVQRVQEDVEAPPGDG